MIYTGIGSRDTPPDILAKMRGLARNMAKLGHTLRSGGGKGADEAFEVGCDEGKGDKEIYLPYEMWRRNPSPLFGSSKEARQIAKQFHPMWENVGNSGRDYLARNTYQILGQDLQTPAIFVCCWTLNGKYVGGTSQAMRIADHYDIPIINLGSMTMDEASHKIVSLLP